MPANSALHHENSWALPAANHVVRWVQVMAAAGLALAGTAACSASAPPDTPLGGDAGSSIPSEEKGPGIVLNPSNGEGRTLEPSGDALSACPVPEEQAACLRTRYEGQATPLDIYVMLDQSGSMCNCVEPVGGEACVPNPTCRVTRLDAVRQAIRAFLEDPRSAGMGVGIGYFGKQPIGQTSCDAADYAEPAVPIGVLPAATAALVSSLQGLAPTGETPTGQAIEAACRYTRSWKQAMPGHQVVNLLLTDGKPEAPVTCKASNLTCCPTLDEAITAATDCRKGSAGQAGIKTYVLGVGPLLQNLDEIAKAGGTDGAYLVEGGDVSGKVLEALNRIRGDAAIPCELAMPPAPPGSDLAYDKVNVTYTDSECHNSTFYYVTSAQGCGTEGGWYYDDPRRPQKIQLCQASCDLVSAPGGRLLYTIGCDSKVQMLK